MDAPVNVIRNTYSMNSFLQKLFAPKASAEPASDIQIILREIRALGRAQRADWKFLRRLEKRMRARSDRHDNLIRTLEARAKENEFALIQADAKAAAFANSIAEQRVRGIDRVDSAYVPNPDEVALARLERIKKEVLIEVIGNTNFDAKNASIVLGIPQIALDLWMRKQGVHAAAPAEHTEAPEHAESRTRIESETPPDDLDDGLTPIERSKKRVLIEYLRRTNFNQAETCRLLGVQPNTLIQWIKKYDIPKPTDHKRGSRGGLRAPADVPITHRFSRLRHPVNENSTGAPPHPV